MKSHIQSILQAVWETSQTIFIVLSPSGEIVEFNESCRKVCGYSREFMLGKKVWDFLLIEEEIEDVRNVFDSLTHSNIQNQNENYWLDKEGAKHRIAWTNTNIVDEQGQVKFIIGTGIDITKQHSSEEELRVLNHELEERVFARTRQLSQINVLLQAMIDNNHTLIAFMDDKFDFIFVNQNYAAADAKTSDYFIGKNHFDLFPNTENQIIFQRVVETGEAHIAMAKPFQYSANPERGTSYWDWTVMPVFGEEKTIFGLVLTLVNVSERILAMELLESSEKSLRQIEQYLRTVINSIPIILFSLDIDGTFILAEGKGLELLGLKSRQVVGLSVFDVFAELPNIHDYFHRVIEGEEINWVAKIRDLYLQTSYSPLYGIDGDIEGITSVSFDISQQIKSEQVQKQSQEDLEIKIAERTLQLSELNNQLTAILETSTEGIAVVDADAQILRQNSALGKILGSDKLSDLSGILEKVGGIRLRSSLFENLADDELRIQVQAQGEEKHLDIAFSPIHDSSQHYLVSLRDISALVTAVERESKARNLAEALLDIPEILSFSLNKDQIFNHILKSLQKIIKYQSALIIQADENNELSVIAHNLQSSFGEILSNTSKINYDVLRTSITARGAKIIDGVYLESDESKNHKPQAILASPIMIDSEIQGYVLVKCADSETPDNYLVELTAFATQLSLALQILKAFEQSAEIAANRERQRLARDLHDAVSQTLFSASMISESLQLFIDKDIEEVRRSSQILEKLSKSALAEMRTLLIELRPNALKESSLQTLIGYLVNSIRAHINANVEFIHSSMEISVPIAAKTGLYRITQEALNNIVKHSQAKTVKVILTIKIAQVSVEIVDDGIGFDSEIMPSQSFGIKIMQERATEAKLSLKVSSNLSHGTHVKVIWEQSEL